MPSERLRQMFEAFGGAPPESRSDAELLTRFVVARDSQAFAALVWRHGPMVRSICWNALRNTADTDDAFQATFMILATKAKSVRRVESVAAWLFGVATRVARRMQSRRTKQPVGGVELDRLPSREVPQADGDLTLILQREVALLPEKYRVVVQLCYTQGITAEAAAAQLGWPRGTVLTRLAWARVKLQKQLTRRGVTLAAVAIGTSLAATPRLPALTRDLVHRTADAVLIRVSTDLLPLVSPVVLQLTHGVLREMVLSKLRILALGCLGLTFAAGTVSYTGIMAGEGQTPSTGKAATTKAAPRAVQPVPVPGAVGGLGSDGPSGGGEMPGSGSPPGGIGGPSMMGGMSGPGAADPNAEILRRLEELDRRSAETALIIQRLMAERPQTRPPQPQLLLPPREIPQPVTPPVSPIPYSGAIPSAQELPQPTTRIPPTDLRTWTVPDRGPMATAGTGGMARPIGIWQAKVENATVELVFTETRMILAIKSKNAVDNVTIIADYSMTKDGVVFGCIVDVDVQDAKGEEENQKTFINGQIDLPFSFRIRSENGRMRIRDVKIASVAPEETNLFRSVLSLAFAASTTSPPPVVPSVSR